MQLDNTSIAIHERGILDTCDLALRVIRRNFRPLVLTFLAGALPLMGLNHYLLGWILDVEYRDMWFYTEESGAIVRYLWDMSLLVLIEAPLASVFLTAYLGQVVFVERPSLSEVMWDVSKMTPQFGWCQLLVRGIAPTWLLLFSLDRYSEFNFGIEFFLLICMAFYVCVLRALRPFNVEIVVLERNPLRSRSRSTLTVGLRSKQLHVPSGSDLIGRWIVNAILGSLLVFATVGMGLFLSGIFLDEWRPGPAMICYGFPVAVWTVVGYLAVVRFLNYLDLRIRHEGWEVELRMRAEAARLRDKMV